jgi:hypothetical protein
MAGLSVILPVFKSRYLGYIEDTGRPAARSPMQKV